MQEETINGPAENDVICEKIPNVKHHKGNTLLREFITNNLQEYNDATNNDKKAVAQRTVRQFQEVTGGRFLKKSKDGSWYIMDQDIVVTKVQQGFRDRNKPRRMKKAVFSTNSSENEVPEVLPGTDPIIPAENDVISGRMSEVYNHSGNGLYRDFINGHAEKYVGTRENKWKAAKDAVDSFRQTMRGRFLAKKDDGNWYEIGDKAAIEKVRQAYRDKKKQKSEAANPGESAQSTNAAGGSSELPKGSKAKIPPPQESVSHSDTMSVDLEDSTVRFMSGDSGANFVTPVAHDVLCNAAGGSNNQHEGNKLYRLYIRNNVESYERASKEQKEVVVQGVINSFRQDVRGRFLDANSDGNWFEISHEKVAERVHEAFKDEMMKTAKKLMECATVGDFSVSIPSVSTGEMTDSSKYGAIIPPGSQSIQPRQNDVLYGTASEMHDHKGNQYYSQFIRNNVEEYFSANKFQKKKLVKGMIDAYRQAGGRFLSRNFDGHWCEMGDQEVVRKLREAYRDKKENSAEAAKPNGESAQIANAADGPSEHTNSSRAGIPPPQESVSHLNTMPVELEAATIEFMVVDGEACTESLITPVAHDVLYYAADHGAYDHHKGNKSFRSYISNILSWYEIVSKEEKEVVAQGVVNSFCQEVGGRFLEINSDGNWDEINDQKVIRERVHEAFRYEMEQRQVLEGARQLMECTTVGNFSVPEASASDMSDSSEYGAIIPPFN